jgi:hypothetical protein
VWTTVYKSNKKEIVGESMGFLEVFLASFCVVCGVVSVIILLLIPKLER